MRLLPALCLMPLALAPAVAQSPGQHGSSPYAGEEMREIKSLSAEDLAELRAGGGWGLAKAAELNGVPGPAHLLELSDEIPLTPEQVLQVEAIRDRMREDAIAEGERLIAHERALEDAFRNGDVTAESLRVLLEAIGASRTELRYIHLAAHLATAPLLTPAQIERYAALRGYSGDVCSSPPPGHDPELWRRHNGCE